jgi:hypothetical protein
MKPMRNAIHFLLLTAWALLGVLFTLHCLGSPGGLLVAGIYWLWLLGFAAVTSVLVARFATPLSAVAVHIGMLLLLALLPNVAWLSLLRFGLTALHAV